ncbi:MAG: hypothetical protein ACR2LC_01540 [Pyrinomonadaceae bacterium]
MASRIVRIKKMASYSYIKIAVAALALCCVVISHSFAQSVAASEPRVANGDSNEDSKTELDLLAQTAGNERLIIAIARLGSGESLRRLNHRRLQTIRWYLKNVREVAESRIVAAEGARVHGRGRVEIYLDGKLFMVFILSRNKNFAPEA